MSALARVAPMSADVSAPARTLPAEFDLWRQQMLRALLAMRRAGIDRQTIEDEIAGTVNALRIMGAIDVQ